MGCSPFHSVQPLPTGHWYLETSQHAGQRSGSILYAHGRHTQARVHTHLHTRFPDTTPDCAASITCDLPQVPSAPHCWNFGKTNTHFGVPSLSLRDGHWPLQTRHCTHKCGDSNGHSLLIPSISKRHRTPGIFLESSRCHSSIRHLAHL